MNQAAFKQAMLFAFSDVRREIALAKVSETEDGRKALERVGVPPGGGNFMAALALLCYPEFAGKLKFNCKTSSAVTMRAETSTTSSTNSGQATEHSEPRATTYTTSFAAGWRMSTM